jgi:hypothetical protein
VSVISPRVSSLQQSRYERLLEFLLVYNHKVDSRYVAGMAISAVIVMISISFVAKCLESVKTVFRTELHQSRKTTQRVWILQSRFTLGSAFTLLLVVSDLATRLVS